MIYLLRHGDAEPTDRDDDARRLTEKGRRQSRAAGRALAATGAKIDACLASPKVRALDTARLACEPLAVEPEVAPELRSGPFDSLSLAAGRGDVLLVGHEPDLSRAIQVATGGHVEMKKGGLAAIEGATLLTLIRPSHLRWIAAARND